MENSISLSAISLATHGQPGRSEIYHLPDLWCLHLYRYEGSVRVDDTVLPIRPGYLSVFPPGARLQYEMHGLSTHLYAHFAFEGSASPFASVAAMTDTGDQFPALNEQLETVVRLFAAQPRRAAVRFWDLLWTLSERYGHPAEASPRRNHPALDRAVGLIELRLRGPISIPAMAREVGLSHNQLLRLFRARFQESIEGYVRSRRAARAMHLLRHTTLPIKAVAVEVGCADLQAFNKAVHRACGKSPRQIRNDGRG